MTLFSQTTNASVRVAAIAGALLLAACSGMSSSVTDAFPDLSPAYAPTSVWYATKDGLRTVVHGNPFGVPQADTDAAVIANLRMPPWHQAGRFVPFSKDGKRRGYRLVLVFNPARPLSSGDACGDLSEIDVGPAGGMTRVRAAFCTRERPLSEIDAVVSATGPSDPEFKQLLADTIDQLLPSRNFNNTDGCKRLNC